MDATNERLLSALRRIRAIDGGERGLGHELLEVVQVAMRGTSATLRHTLEGTGELRVGSAVDDVVRIERTFSARSGVAVLTVERESHTPFDDEDVRLLEALAGEVVLRLEQERADVETNRLRRQIELLRALSRTTDAAAVPFDVADRAANEVRNAFAGAHVLIHAVTPPNLELIARRTERGIDMEEAPEWVRVLALDGPTSMAIAAREKRTVSRPIREIAPQLRAEIEKMGIRHMMVVPLSFQDVVLGTLMVAHRRDEPWDAESLRLLETVAEQLGAELAQARILEAERRRADDLGLVNEIGGLVAKHLDLHSVLSTTARTLARVLEVARVHVVVGHEKSEHLAGVAFANDAVTDLELPLQSSHAVVHAMQTRAPVVIEDAETDKRTNKELVARVGTRSLAIVPLIAQGAAIGVIVLVETRHKRRFTENEVARVVAVANVIAQAVTNAKMFEDLRRSYEALARAQAELVTHERLAALGELSAVIAHEVRNPVAIIYNSLSELRRRAPPAPEAAVLLDIIGEETTRLNRIVGDLLDFVRPYDVHPRIVRLDAVVNGAVEAARRAAPVPCVEIRTEVSRPSQTLFVDGTMLQQALLNLIVNAIQASPEGKSVSVRVDVVPGADCESLRCEIADEGLGIDDATSARIFQPFFTTKATGTGLGLALVRRLAEALRGTVIPERRPTGGALFTLTVPLPRSDSCEVEPT